MSGGITKKLEKTIEALDKKQIMNALFITEKRGLENHHKWVKEAAEVCAAGDEKACSKALKEAKEKIVDTMTAPLESTDVEELKAYLKEDKTVANQDTQAPEGATAEVDPNAGKTDEELYAECEECHIANAVVQAAKVCEVNPSENICGKLGEKLDDPDVDPTTWVKTLVEVKDSVKGEKAKKQMTGIIDELHGYLKDRGSPLLSAFEGGDQNAETT